MNSYRIYRNVQDSFSNRQKLERLHNIVIIKRIDTSAAPLAFKKKEMADCSAHIFTAC